MNIILYLLQLIQLLYQQNIWLINFICKYIPIKQWAFDDSHSPKYQKFKIDKLPLILHVEPWDYRDFMKYLEWRCLNVSTDIYFSRFNRADFGALFFHTSLDTIYNKVLLVCIKFNPPDFLLVL